MGKGSATTLWNRVDEAMKCHTAARSVSDFAEIYSRLYGGRAYQEALDYALVVRSVGDRSEHDFWLQVADALHAEPPLTRQLV